MKAVLTTLGRFHSFDLARQLLRHDSLGVIYSGYPRFKLKAEGLPSAKVRTFPYIHAPYMASGWRHRIGTNLLRHWEYWDRRLLDTYVATTLPDADVFIGLSGCGLATGRVAKRRGIAYVCDRGSTHIRYQHEILESEYARWGLPFEGIDPRIVEREEAEYTLADVITVPSGFVKQTFVDRGVPEHKLALLPYGVDLERFKPVGAPLDGRLDLLFVGGLNVRKGLPYLLQAYVALRHPRKSLTLAGIAEPGMLEMLKQRDLLPDDVRILGHVPQPKLKDLMSRSHALVLPSLEEGLAMVMAQAMACGCPVIATRSAGAADLFSDGVEGFIVDGIGSAPLLQRLEALADSPELREKMSHAARQRVLAIDGWAGYGDRAVELYRQVC